MGVGTNTPYDRSPRLQRTRAGAEDDVEGPAAVAHRRGADIARCDVVRVPHVLAARRQVRPSRHVVDDVTDGGLDTGPGEQPLGVLPERVAGEVVGERRELVGEHVLAGGEHAQFARPAGEAFDLADVLDDLAVLVDPLHRVGLQGELVLDRDPADEDPDAGDGEQHRGARRDAPQPHDEPTERSGAEVTALGRRLELADAEDRERQDDGTDADRGDPDREQQAEIADHRHLGEMQRREREDRVKGDDEQRGPEIARGLLDRVFGAVDHHLFLDARVHLDRVVDPDAQHHRKSGDGHDGEGDTEVSRETERPDHADDHHEQRQQAPPHLEQHEQDQDHDQDRDPAERQHPAAQIVVDVLEQDGRTGRHARRVVEMELRRFLLDQLGRLALGLDRGVPGETSDDLRGVVVEEHRRQRLPHVALVVVEEELHPLRVVEGAFGSGDRDETGERLDGVLRARGRGGRPRLLRGLRREQRLGGGALGGVAVRTRDERVGEPQDAQRTHHRLDRTARLQPVVELLQPRGAVAGEELVDGVALVHRDDGEHGLATEEALVDDVVLVDGFVRVEVAVLTGRELQLGDPEPERDRDHESDDRHPDRVLAELHRDVGPEPLHHTPRLTSPRAA